MQSPIRCGSGSRALGTVGGIAALLGARNVAEIALPAVAYVPTNVGVGAVLLVVARRSGSSPSFNDLGYLLAWKARS